MVPGGLQTVPRAEVWGPLVSLQSLNLETPCSKLDTDANYVISNSLKLLHNEEVHPTKGPLAGAHGDIWSSIQQLLQRGSIPIPTKVESHLKEELIGEAISPLEYFMNGIADALASLAVRVFDYPDKVQKQVDHNARTAFLVCMRLAVIGFAISQWLLANHITRLMPYSPPRG